MLVECNLKFGATDLKMSKPEDRVLCVEQGPFAPLIVACVESHERVGSTSEKCISRFTHIFTVFGSVVLKISKNFGFPVVPTPSIPLFCQRKDKTRH